MIFSDRVRDGESGLNPAETNSRSESDIDVGFKKRFVALKSQARGLDGVAAEGGKVARKSLECNMTTQ